MTSDKDNQKIVRVVRWDRLRTDEAEKEIRERLADPGANLIIGNHAYDRIELRSINDVDVLNILQKGSVLDQPELQENGRDWKIVMVRRMPGGRYAGVVTIIFSPPSRKLFVKTVEWMDRLT